MMGRPVRSGAEAVKIASGLAQDAGLFWFNISRAHRQGTKWVVFVDVFGSRYRAVISARSGEVLDWKRLQRR